MPWLPEFVSAVELSRLQTRADGLSDPATQYIKALDRDNPRALETVWPGKVVVHDPYRGEIRGHRQLRQFIHANHAWFAEHEAQVETLVATRVEHRAVLELIVHMLDDDNRSVDWPVAVVTDSPDDLSVSFRAYCSQWPRRGGRNSRPAFMSAADTGLADLVARHLRALADGDPDAVMTTFSAEGYYREPVGPDSTHKGTAELRSFFDRRLSHGGIELQQYAVTDDGLNCAVEWNCVRWSGVELLPQAGLSVFERAGDGRLAGVRTYDDLEPVSDAA